MTAAVGRIPADFVKARKAAHLKGKKERTHVKTRRMAVVVVVQ